MCERKFFMLLLKNIHVVSAVLGGSRKAVGYATRSKWDGLSERKRSIGNTAHVVTICGKSSTLRGGTVLRYEDRRCSLAFVVRYNPMATNLQKSLLGWTDFPPLTASRKDHWGTRDGRSDRLAKQKGKSLGACDMNLVRKPSSTPVVCAEVIVETLFEIPQFPVGD